MKADRATHVLSNAELDDVVGGHHFVVNNRVIGANTGALTPSGSIKNDVKTLLADVTNFFSSFF
jgi:hypothetical protein